MSTAAAAAAAEAIDVDDVDPTLPLVEPVPRTEYASVRGGLRRTSRYTISGQIGEGTYGCVVDSAAVR